MEWKQHFFFFFLVKKYCVCAASIPQTVLEPWNLLRGCFAALGGTQVKSETWGQGGTEKEADPSRWDSGKFKKEGNLLTRLVLSSCKMSRSPHPPA